MSNTIDYGEREGKQTPGRCGITLGAMLLQKALADHGMTAERAASELIYLRPIRPASLQAWKEGIQCPKKGIKKALFKRFGIPVESWSVEFTGLGEQQPFKDELLLEELSHTVTPRGFKAVMK